jgi:hypothetical protein
MCTLLEWSTNWWVSKIPTFGPPLHLDFIDTYNILKEYLLVKFNPAQFLNIKMFEKQPY